MSFRKSRSEYKYKQKEWMERRKDVTAFRWRDPIGIESIVDLLEKFSKNPDNKDLETIIAEIEGKKGLIVTWKEKFATLLQFHKVNNSPIEDIKEDLKTKIFDALSTDWRNIVKLRKLISSSKLKVYEDPQRKYVVKFNDTRNAINKLYQFILNPYPKKKFEYNFNNSEDLEWAGKAGGGTYTGTEFLV